MKRFQYAAKRALDYGVAATGLVVCAPAMLGIAIAIKIDSPGSVFFVQERLGRNGRVFRLLKFRTMIDAPIRYNADGSTRIDANDNRVTRVGRYLRGAADELPQLINILRGEMSLVGPRPDMATQLELYTDADRRKLEVLPGITSLAIVHGRNEIPWKNRIAIDVHYVDHWSLWLDLGIILQTIFMPFRLNILDSSRFRAS